MEISSCSPDAPFEFGGGAAVVALEGNLDMEEELLIETEVPCEVI